MLKNSPASCCSGTLISLSNSASAEGLSVTGNAMEGIKCEYTHNLTGKDLASCEVMSTSLNYSKNSFLIISHLEIYT